MKFYLDTDLEKILKLKTSKPLLILCDLKENILIPYLDELFKQNNLNVYNYISKNKKILNNEVLIDKNIILFNYRIFNRPLNLQLCFKNNNVTLKTFFDEKFLLNNNIDILPYFLFNLTKVRTLKISKDIKPIFIIHPFDKFFSKKIMEYLIEKNIIDVIKINHLDVESKIVYYKSEFDKK